MSAEDQYMSNMASSCAALPLQRVTFEYASEMFPYFKKRWKAIGAMLETSSSWGRMGPAMYLTRKLLWDVDADAAAICQDYFDKAFGNGAKEMHALFDLLRQFDRALLNLSLQLSTARLEAPYPQPVAAYDTPHQDQEDDSPKPPPLPKRRYDGDLDRRALFVPNTIII